MPSARRPAASSPSSHPDQMQIACDATHELCELTQQLHPQNQHYHPPYSLLKNDVTHLTALPTTRSSLQSYVKCSKNAAHLSYQHGTSSATSHPPFAQLQPSTKHLTSYHMVGYQLSTSPPPPPTVNVTICLSPPALPLCALQSTPSSTHVPK